MACQYSELAGRPPTSLSRRSQRNSPTVPCRLYARSSHRASSEADLYDPRIGVDSYHTSDDYTLIDSALALPLYVKVPGALAAMLAVTRVLGAVMRRQRRNALEERGFKRESAADEDHYSRMMKGMKTVRYDELSEEQVAAARKRRQREVANDSIDIDALELPSNHPFAVKQEVSKEEEEVQRQRLLARRGLSAQDLELLRKTQEEAERLE
jgi:hypothetical protein